MLRKEAAAVLSYATDHPEISPQRIADMLFRTRVARRNRAVAMVADRATLLAALYAIAEDTEHRAVVRTTAPAIARSLAYVFPGQGGQRPGMGRLYYESIPAFRAAVDRCDETFHGLFGESPLKYLLDEHVPADDSAQVVQPALFMQMVGLAAMWQAVGIVPTAVIGHSQGEIAAAYVSGKMTLADAAFIVGTRARAVEKISSDTYAMAVVAADRDECEALLTRRSGWAQVSVINAPNMVGISGERDTVHDIVDTLADRGTFARVIRVRYPAHTNLVNEFRDDVRDAVRRQLTNEYFLDSEIDCLGATLGDSITTDLPVGEYWFWNLRNTVRFDKAIAAAAAKQIDTFVELADHPTLQLSIQENLSACASDQNALVVGTSSRTAADLGEFARNLALLAVNDLDYRWDSLRVESPGAVRLPLRDFPNVVMNDVSLWLPYNSGAPRPGTVAVPEVAAPVVEPVAETSTATTQLVVEDWTRLVRRSLVSPRRIGIIDHTGECAELAAGLCAEAVDHGATARLIDAHTESDRDGLDTLVILLPGLPDATAAAAADATADFFGTRRWWPGLTDDVTTCWLVTVGGEAVLPDDAPPHPVYAAASAGFRCVGTEHPGVAFRHLDLAPEQTGTAAAAAITMALHTAGESELALRGAGLYAKRLIEADQTVLHASRPENIVIIGGTGSLGLEFCAHFAQHHARRITLVSRSGASPAVTERLARIRESGSADIRVVACDVGDAAAARLLADETRDAPAHLIIHAAADYSDIVAVELSDITPELVLPALRGKFVGIANVLDTLDRADDCQVVLCSSLVATLGGRGKIVYAAANRMLDALAHRVRAEGTDCVSVQWGQWGVYQNQSSSDAAQLAAVGYLPMPSADAITLGLGGLRRNAVVAAFDWAVGHSVLGAYGYGPVLSTLAASAAAAAAAEPIAADRATVEQAELPQRMTRLLADVLGVDDITTIDTTRPLVAIGLDSLQALDFRRRVKAAFDHDVPVTELLGGASVDEIVRTVQVRSPGQPRRSEAAAQATPVPAPSPITPAAARPSAVPTRADIAERARQTAEHAVPADLDAAQIRSARSDLDLFGLRAMVRTLDPALGDGAAHTVDDIMTRLEFTPRHRWLLNRWLGVLTEHGCLAADPSHGYRVAGAVPTPTRPDLFTVCADLGYSVEFATFLQRSDEELTALAQDRVRVQELLFPDGDMLTAEAAYRENIISRYLNLAAREVVSGIAARIERDRSPVRILELGAGIGGTTTEVAAGLSGLPVDYHFTDLSTYFLGAAQERFTDYPWMRYGIVDMNDGFAAEARYDLVLGANVLHNARHIGQTLRALHDVLDPGGAVVFIEACRATYPVLTSMKFLMSPAPGQPHPGQHDIRAGARIFLTEDEWQSQLVAAGFTPMLVLPTADHPLHPLDQRIFAAVRD
ncbi:nocobactin polyketide synthase NbtC [Nocardia altamirensis]|uniref:nocobactin polyketide synthase NbtC n=1 Tax=Nocardia altamirensis TaxID=472158 RepID=UPI003F761845